MVARSALSHGGSCRKQGLIQSRCERLRGAVCPQLVQPFCCVCLCLLPQPPGAWASATLFLVHISPFCLRGAFPSIGKHTAATGLSADLLTPASPCDLGGGRVSHLGLSGTPSGGLGGKLSWSVNSSRLLSGSRCQETLGHYPGSNGMHRAREGPLDCISDGPDSWRKAVEALPLMQDLHWGFTKCSSSHLLHS